MIQSLSYEHRSAYFNSDVYFRHDVVFESGIFCRQFFL